MVMSYVFCGMDYKCPTYYDVCTQNACNLALVTVGSSGDGIMLICARILQSPSLR